MALLRYRAILEILVEAEVLGGYSRAHLRRVLAHLARSRPAVGAMWRLLALGLGRAASVAVMYQLFCRSLVAFGLCP